MDEIHDIHGLRLIVENEDECYKALDLVHKLWSEVPGKFKDYIKHPKCNGYQSLHTVVMGEGSVPLEVQIRTKEMHSQAEFGFAAHWRYKEGESKHSSFVVQMVEWARWVVTWQCENMSQEEYKYKPPCTFPFHSEDCPHSYKPSCGSEGPVFVIIIENDKVGSFFIYKSYEQNLPSSFSILECVFVLCQMSVQELAANSSVKDVLNISGSRFISVKEELRPRVNHEPVRDLGCKLKMGDVVELTPRIPDKSLTEYREEIQRMYDRGLSVTNSNRWGR